MKLPDKVRYLIFAAALNVFRQLRNTNIVFIYPANNTISELNLAQRATEALKFVLFAGYIQKTILFRNCLN
jgi:hypothetical protein